MFDFSNMVGDATLMAGGAASAGMRRVTDLTPHVDGGPASTAGTNVTNSPDQHQVLWASVAIVLIALALLWTGGVLVFSKLSV